MKKVMWAFQAVMDQLEQRGYKTLPKDHPIYSEGSSITLSSRTRGQSPAKDTTSTPVASPNVLDSTENENTSSND
jgi:hypothetical protein